MKRYRYFVAYAVRGGGNARGVELHSGSGAFSVIANKIVTVANLISTEKDLRDVERGIADELADGMRTYVYVQIVSFQLLGEFESEEEGVSKE
ncbi:MAG: hypothetical protein HZA35_04135 [Parcubacteria group bacterium]|nr:hypothetical protein [Parcubacteria group bacterium]